MSIDGRRRWLALIVLCLGTLMIVLDTTIVNVALPSIRQDLGFSETSLAWVVNAYTLTFGGFLLLGGRLGDLFGHRRLFLSGITLFTLASLVCGLSTTQGFLITARLLGGVLTNVLNWHWIFLVNLPVGIAVFALSLFLLPGSRGLATGARLDVAGAITVTASLVLAVYAIVNGNQVGWMSGQTIGMLAIAAVLLAIFLRIEAVVKSPLMPLGLFRQRNVATANVIGVLWTAAMFAWFFISALYLQLVLGYGPLQVGLAFLPANLIMGAFSLGLSARIVTRFGIRLPLAIGLLLAAVGLALFARAPVGGNFAVDVLPGMILLGLGAGIAFNPVLLAALNDVAPEDSGLASGVVNTSFMMGGALGLAILASLAASRTDSLLAIGNGHLAALNGGYQAAFLVASLFAVLASGLGAALLRFTTQTTPSRDESIDKQPVLQGDKE